ncbi:signal transduction histidine kinase [Paenibacillus sp. DS2363]|uniref:sensor histidine kinase n=1 Tax=Paenibacillus TaxID=44249 RepID=UPI00209F4BBD|nr:HAMP domain-containing sensor histidine kinase [Paenibacillus xylanexedens]MCP1426505.1 signal transduction histidine kinase [Paenibacillus xylanexedens]
MNRDAVLMLSGLQLIIGAGALVLEYYTSLTNSSRMWLFAAFVFTSILVLVNQYQIRSKQQSIAAELHRAVNGEGKRRILSKGNVLLDEIVFAANDLMEQLESVKIDAQRSQAARKSLLSSISHDIRTPLTSMIGYVDALKDDIASTEEERRDYMDILSRKSKDLKKMIDEMFTMAKLDADEMPMQAEPLDLAELTREILIEFIPSLKKAEMDLEIQIPDYPCFVMADRLSINRLISNLIQNSIQYGHEGGVLGIEIASYHLNFQLTVWDQGPGISEKELNLVFERMYRSDHSRSPVFGASGLGLSIARTLAEKNEGHLQAESTPGVKTSFIFTIPKYKRLSQSQHN